jgi:disulfide bond formation protein DsbB
MRWWEQRVVMLMTFVFLALAVAQGGSAASVATGIAVIAVGMLLAARSVGVAVTSRELTIGARARQHRESLSDVAAPRHPLTPGRPKSRAPSEAFSAA